MQFLMHHLLYNRAKVDPQKEAIVQEERRFSYQELGLVTNRLARLLLEGGAERGDRIGVFLDHSLDQVFSFYGILKAGCVYVPINSQLLGDQVHHVASDCQIRAMIVDAARLDRLRGHIGNWNFLHSLLVLGDPPAWLSALPLKIYHFEDIFGSSIDYSPVKDTCIGHDLAALLYTSGSTGRPKGVMITHDNLIAGARIVTSYLENRESDRLLGVLPLSFDYGLNQVTGSALVGMTYVMKSFRFPGELVDVLKGEKITGFAGIPTIWLLLLQFGSPVYKNTFEHLRYITNSGGFLPVSAIQKLKTVFPETKIVLMYGLTEAFRSTYLPPDQIERRPNSIGKAIPGVEILVVNKEGKLCGPGEPGELVHRGPTVSRGYWGDLEKTQKVFRPNHFLPPGFENTERLVYSGDIVRKDEEGYLYFIGREDHMIKCHGHRISPAEIEDVLYASGRVKLTAVVGIPDAIRGQSIKAFVVPSDGDHPTDDDILSVCAEKLPAFMIPRFVQICADLPRTGTGKIDLAQLIGKEA